MSAMFHRTHRQDRLWDEVGKHLAPLFAVGSCTKPMLHWLPRHGTKCSSLPKFALQGADFSIHRIRCFGGILQLPLELPTGCIRSLGLLFCLLQLALQLLQAYVCLVRLSVYGAKSNKNSVFPQSCSTVIRAVKKQSFQSPPFPF